MDKGQLIQVQGRDHGFQKKYGVARSKYWGHILEGREVEASKKLFKSEEMYSEHKNPLTPFSVGDSGSVQKGEMCNRKC